MTPFLLTALLASSPGLEGANSPVRLETAWVSSETEPFAAQAQTAARERAGDYLVAELREAYAIDREWEAFFIENILDFEKRSVVARIEALDKRFRATFPRAEFDARFTRKTKALGTDRASVERLWKEIEASKTRSTERLAAFRLLLRPNTPNAFHGYLSASNRHVGSLMAIFRSQALPWLRADSDGSQLGCACFVGLLLRPYNVFLAENSLSTLKVRAADAIVAPKKGDVIVGISFRGENDRVPVESFRDLLLFAASIPKGRLFGPLTLWVRRAGVTKVVRIVVTR